MTNRLRIVIFLLALIAAVPAHADLAELSWLTGCWAMDGEEDGSVEQWTAPAGGSMLALNRTVRNGKTVAFEFIRVIVKDDGEIVLIASPSGQETAHFSLVSKNDHEVSFENEHHDFPQRIIYRRIDANVLLGRIEGVVNGEVRVVDFPMTKTSCDSTLRTE
jgi:hypothetical protein